MSASVSLFRGEARAVASEGPCPLGSRTSSSHNNIVGTIVQSPIYLHPSALVTTTLLLLALVATAAEHEIQHRGPTQKQAGTEER